MVEKLIIPDLGESISEVQIGQWFKSEGDWVELEEPVVEIESEKATVELPAPVAGVLISIDKKTGDQARVGDAVGAIDPGASSGTKTRPEEKKPKEGADAESKRVMPSAARLAHERGIDAASVAASGPGGRVLKEDVRHAGSEAPPAAAEEPNKTEETAAAAPVQARFARERLEEVVRMSPLRRTIARRLVEASQNAALLTTFNEIDMTTVKELRVELGEAFQKRHGIKLGFMSFFVKAVTSALAQIPELNAQVDGDDIIYRQYCDVGIAIGGGKGLVVPVLRDAEAMNFADIEKAIADFGARAKQNQIGMEELQGGTFSITNGGIYGSMLSTPIVNPPQSGILGLHAITDRPVARDGQVVIRPMMNVALTYDHRIVDGREAVTFLLNIKRKIENPARLLLEI